MKRQRACSQRRSWEAANEATTPFSAFVPAAIKAHSRLRGIKGTQSYIILSHVFAHVARKQGRQQKKKTTDEERTKEKEKSSNKTKGRYRLRNSPSRAHISQG